MGYVLEKQQKGDDKWERCNDFLVPVLSYTVRGLTEAKSYSFRVRAENAAGVSEPSRNTPFVKASDAVGKELTRVMSLCSPTCSGQMKTKLFSLSDPPKVFLSGSLQSGLSVKRGTEICLTANISGSPYPEITWYWNNQVIRPEALRKRPEKALRKKVEKEEKKEVVAETEKKDEKEEVKEGEDKKKEGEEEKKAEGEEKKPEEEEKKAEEPAEQEEEPDYPTINERLAVDNRRRGTSSIVVRDSVRADYGVYTVKVENDHGTASATCEVNVLGRCSRFSSDYLIGFKEMPDNFGGLHQSSSNQLLLFKKKNLQIPLGRL